MLPDFGLGGKGVCTGNNCTQNAFLTTGQHSERQEVRKWENQPGLAEVGRGLLEEARFLPETWKVEK